MTLIYATSNAAKLEHMRSILDGMGISLLGLKDVQVDLPDVDETGTDPLQNAQIKALTYYHIIKQPLFSCDSGLFLQGLPTELQPGVNVRTVNGKRLTDSEMTEYYSGLAHNAGGRITAWYKNGICLVMSANKVFSHSGDDISYDKFYLTDTPHRKRVAGFPLDSLSVHIESGKYYYDLEESFKLERKSNDAFRDFFKRVLDDSLPLI